MSYDKTTGLLSTETLTYRRPEDIGCLFFSNGSYIETIQPNKIPTVILSPKSIDPDEISYFDIVVPVKVLKVYFADGKYIKVVCHQQDDFSIKRGLFIALAKKKYGKEYTVDGIEYMATQLSYLKKYDKMVDKVIKAQEREEKQKTKEAVAERRKEMVKANKKRKHEAYLKRRDEKRRQSKIDE